MWESWIGELYEKCVYVALDEGVAAFAQPDAQQLWKPTFAQISKAPQRQWSQAVYTLLRVRQQELRGFTASLLRRIRAIDKFRDATYVVEYTPPPLWHLSSDSDARAAAWKAATSFILDQSHFKYWRVKLRLRFAQRGQVLLWQPQGLVEFITYAIPEASRRRCEDLVKTAKVDWSAGPTAWSGARGVVPLEELPQERGFETLEWKVVDYEDVKKYGAWRAYGAEAILPRNIGPTLQAAKNALELMRMAGEDAIEEAAVDAELEGTGDIQMEGEGGDRGGLNKPQYGSYAEVTGTQPRAPACPVMAVDIRVDLSKAEEALHTVEDRDTLFYIVRTDTWW